jgi:N-methylhydantoinase B
VCNNDGQSATVCLNDGDTHNTPVESAEAKVPFVITRRELRVDSAGPGKFRGGLGVAQEVRMLVPGRLETKVERTQCAPWGLLGGKDALANAVAVVHENGRVERFDTGKLPLTEIPIESGYIIETGGGGGFGPPWERDPQRVLDDVRSGYVTPEAAAADYDVVVRGEGFDAELDIRETDERRRQLTKGAGQ